MKVAISGKGGVGKTTVAGLLARYLVAQGRPVIAVDADPDANLASALGIPAAEVPTPISEMRQLIEERTESKKGYGTYFTLNPRVDDIPERFCARQGLLRLLVLGGVRSGGSGCICPESTLLKALVTHLILGREEVVILDMEAGIEHLGRATSQAVSVMVIVVEPGQRSIQTAHTVRRLAADLGIPQVAAVINKVPPGTDTARVVAGLDGLPVLGTLPYDPAIMQADIENRSPFTGVGEQQQALARMVAALEAITAQVSK